MTLLGISGAGTMGCGIAQVAVLAGMRTVLQDPYADALERGVDRIADALARGAEKGRWSMQDAAHARARLRPVERLGDLSDCDFVIEAAPEDVGVKRDVMRDLAEICGPRTVFATNTSSIPVTAIAAAVPEAERVIGMHFFNPVPAMRLVEVVPAMQTSASTLDCATRHGKALGKHVIVAQDGPGFLVNRLGRPFYGEALRLVSEGVAEPAQIDRICRVGGGFRMGPFELMDLVGIDVALAVARSLADGSFGEPRWRPSPLQARMVAGGRLGRKSGTGWYRYDDGSYRPPDPDPPPPEAATGRSVTVLGAGRVARLVRHLARRGGLEVHARPSPFSRALIVADDLPVVATETDQPIVLCATRSLASWRMPRAVGFNLLPLPDSTVLVELTRTAATSARHAAEAEALFSAMGLLVEWVGDAPALVLGRIVSQIVNEACFAVGEGVACADDVETAVTLGLNYPRGALAWGELLGWDVVAATLEGIWEERREERYRPAPLLFRAAMTGEAPDA